MAEWDLPHPEIPANQQMKQPMALHHHPSRLPRFQGFRTLANWGMLNHKNHPPILLRFLGRLTISPIKSIGPGLPGGRSQGWCGCYLTPPPTTRQSQGRSAHHFTQALGTRNFLGRLPSTKLQINTNNEQLNRYKSCIKTK